MSDGTKQPVGIPLSLEEARLVAGQIRAARGYADTQYWPWVIGELCSRVERAEAEVVRLQGMITGLCGRVAGQSEALSKRAERPAKGA